MGPGGEEEGGGGSRRGAPACEALLDAPRLHGGCGRRFGSEQPTWDGWPFGSGSLGLFSMRCARAKPCGFLGWLFSRAGCSSPVRLISKSSSCWPRCFSWVFFRFLLMTSPKAPVGTSRSLDSLPIGVDLITREWSHVLDKPQPEKWGKILADLRGASASRRKSIPNFRGEVLGAFFRVGKPRRHTAHQSEPVLFWAE